MFYLIQLEFPFLCFRNNHRSHCGDISFLGGTQCVFDWLHQDTEIQNLREIMIITIAFNTGGFLSGVGGAGEGGTRTRGYGNVVFSFSF